MGRPHTLGRRGAPQQPRDDSGRALVFRHGGRSPDREATRSALRLAARDRNDRRYPPRRCRGALTGSGAQRARGRACHLGTLPGRGAVGANGNDRHHQRAVPVGAAVQHPRSMARPCPPLRHRDRFDRQLPQRLHDEGRRGSSRAPSGPSLRRWHVDHTDRQCRDHLDSIADSARRLGRHRGDCSVFQGIWDRATTTAVACCWRCFLARTLPTGRGGRTTHRCRCGCATRIRLHIGHSHTSLPVVVGRSGVPSPHGRAARVPPYLDRGSRGGAAQTAPRSARRTWPSAHWIAPQPRRSASAAGHRSRESSRIPVHGT